MYIESVPNRNSPPAILLRESCRDAGKVRKRTLANLSKWPTSLVEGLRILLKGGTAVADLTTAFDIIRSRPHGHVAAVLGTLRKLRLDRLIAPAASPERARVIALIVARLLAPGSKLATARGLAADTARDSLAEALGIDTVDEDALHAAMDWLLERQGVIGQRLAKRHLSDGALVLYDLSSSYFEGRCCPLAKRGYSRDGKRGKLQIVFGLLCNREGCPIAVEVFEGNTADPRTVGAQVDKLRRRFALERVVLVGDRGMLTEARIREEVAPAGLDWITTLRAPAIRELVSSGAVQRSMFDDTDLAELRSDAYPGERLIVCRNERLATERARKREALLQATEALLAPIVAATQREKRRLKGQEKIALRVGKVIGKYKMAKHFELDITETAFTWRRNADAIAAEAALDGLYIVRTSVPATELDAEHTVRAYKGLSVVERAFRSLKTVDLKVRPICHYAASRVRAHVFPCMLAYYATMRPRGGLSGVVFGVGMRSGEASDRSCRGARQPHGEELMPAPNIPTTRTCDIPTLGRALYGGRDGSLAPRSRNRATGSRHAAHERRAAGSVTTRTSARPRAVALEQLAVRSGVAPAGAGVALAGNRQRRACLRAVAIASMLALGAVSAHAVDTTPDSVSFADGSLRPLLTAAECTTTPEQGVSTDCLLNRTLGQALNDVVMGEVTRYANERGRELFGERFRLTNRLSWSPGGSGISGDIDAVFPVSFAATQELAPGAERVETSALFFQWGVTRWTDGNGVPRDDLRYGVVRRFALSDTPHADVVGLSAMFQHNQERGHGRLVAGIDYSGTWGSGWLHHFMPTTGWRPGRSGFEERALAGMELGLRVKPTTTIALESAVTRWEDKDGSGRWKTGARVGLGWQPHPWLTFRTAWEKTGAGDDSASIGVVFSMPLGGDRRERPRWEGLGLTGGGSDPETDAPDLWRPIEHVGALQFGERSVRVPAPTPASTSTTCYAGQVLRTGERCTFPGTNLEFTVLASGSARLGRITVGTRFANYGTLYGQQITFVASRQSDGSWLIERVGDSESQDFAPADQAAFDAVAVGKRIVGDDPSSYTDYVSSGRFREVDGSDTYTGRYTYENTGPNSATVDFRYDDGDRCTFSVAFDSATAGFLTYSCNDGTTGASSWRIVDIDPPVQAADLVVQSASVSDAGPDAGGAFTLSATVRNQGSGPSAATTLRYYRSSDATISASDTAVGTDAVGALSASGTSAESIPLTAPSSAGTYYYGACVDAPAGESDTGNNCSASVTVTVGAAEPPVGTAPVLHDAIAPPTYTVGRFIPALTLPAATGGEGALSYTLTPAVPGLSFDAATRRLSGRPTQAGTYEMTYRASDAGANTATRTFTLHVQATGDFAPRMLSTVDSSTYTVGTAIPARTLPLAFGGNGAVSYTLTPAVPGLSFNAATRRFSGTPTQAGTYAMTYRAGDADANTADTDTATRTFTLHVQGAGDFAPRMFGTVAAPTYTVGTAITPLTLPVAFGGNGVRTYTLTPEVPGLSFDPATRRLSGTPTRAGVWRMTYRAGDADANTADTDTAMRAFTLTVEAADDAGVEPAADLVVQSASVSDAGPDAGGAFTLSATVRNQGSGPSAATTLRYYRSSDATISASDTAVGTDAVGALSASGTSAESIPLTAPSSAGTYYYGACVDAPAGESDTGNNCSASVTVTVGAAEPPVGTAPVLHDAIAPPTYTVGRFIPALTLPAATGGEGALSYTLTPAVPGLSFDAATRRLSGRPTQAGTYEMTYRASDAGANTATRTFTLHVQATGDFAPRMLSTVDSSTYTVGTAIPARTLPLAFGGNGAVSYTLTPAVPGLSFNAATRRFSGTPTQAGTYAMTYRAGDADANTADTDTATRTFTLHVQGAGDFAPRMFGTVAAPTYTVGTAITPLTLPVAFGGNGVRTYTLTPEVPGLSFDPATRRLSGTPTRAGVWRMTYRAGDADANTADTDTAMRAFTLTVEAADDAGVEPAADLVVQSASVSDAGPDAGGAFTLSATVRNQGSGPSAATTLRYYRSSDATISASDTAVGTDAVGALSASGTSAESIPLTAPSSAGTYYYGACVDAPAGESDTGNNCSASVTVTVGAAEPPVGTAPVLHDAIAPPTYTVGRFIPALTLPAATGGEGALSYTLTPAVPGLSFDAATRRLSGRPTQAGTYEMTYRASDAGANTATRTFTLHVQATGDFAPRMLSTVDSSTYTVGTAIPARTLPLAFGGNGAVSYTLTPAVPGLSFNAATRRFSGTPTQAGTYAMTYRAGDADANTADTDTATRTFTLHVQGAGDFAPRMFGTVAAPTYTVGTAITPLTLPVAFGGNGVRTYTLTPEVPGLSFDPATRRLSGTPTRAGVWRMTYRAGDADANTADSDTAMRAFTLTVEAADDAGVEPAADLVVQSASVSDAGPDAGGAFTLSATVRNQGSGPSAATTLRYYRSSDATISTSDTAVGTDAVSSLSASGTSAEFVSLTAPSSAGTYYYGACVDTVSGESNTANNCSSGVRVTVSSGGSGGNSFGVGTALPGVPTSGPFIPARLTPRLTGGSSLLISGGTTTINFGNGGVMQLQDGTVYTCRASGAGGCQVRNGIVTRGTIVRGGGTPPPSGAADLAVGSPSVSDASPDAGASFTLRATVRNGGDGRSAATTLRYYRSSDATISTSDTAVGTDAVRRLSASGTSAEFVSLTAPSSAGTYYYGACVDTVSGESNTANNCSSAVRVSVAAPTVPDLLVGSASVSDSSPDAGASFTLRATVRNGGDGRSAVTTLRYYRSSDATISTSDTAVGTDAVGGLAASGTSAESVSLTAPSSAGTYYYGACVDTVSGESNTANNCSSAVRVTVSSGGGSDDHGNTRSDATSLSLGSSRSGRIETGSDVDYFRVRVSGSGTLTVHTTGSLDTQGELQSSSGSILTSNDDGGSGRNFRIQRSVSAGTYYVKVVSFDSRTGNYTIHVTVSSGGGSDDHGNTRSDATSLSLGSSRSGRIETGSDVDYFRVRVSGSGTLTVHTTGSLDTQGELQSSSGSILTSNDDGGSGRNFRIQRSVSAGTYYVKVVSYSSRTGNYTIHASTAAAAASDLAVGSPSVSDASPGAGGSFTLRATVRNAGDGRSAATTLRYYRSSDATISASDTAVGTDAVGGLAASGTSAESVSLTAPSSAGTYYYGACVDTVSGESNTANNCSSAVRVSVAAPTVPDLLVGSASVSHSSPDAGASFTLRATVRNGGDGRSAVTTLRYYRSSDATISTSDTAVGTDAVGGLAASGTSAESISLTAPSSAGTYYYGACVDSVSGESNTRNNCSSGARVTVDSRGTALTGSFTSPCTVSRPFAGSSILNVTMRGTVQANRSVFSVRVEGRVDGEYVGTDFLGNMSNGQSKSFNITGVFRGAIATTLKCEARYKWSERS